MINNNIKTDLPGTVIDNEINKSESNNVSDESKASSNGGSRVKSAKPLAFEVEGSEDASLIKRHPPLRFRRLEDQQVEINQEMINIKQEEAEKRRTAVRM